MTGKESKGTSAAASMVNVPPSTAPSAVEAIEEDDEFEEFEPCQWNANDEDAEDSQQWQVRACRSYSCLFPHSSTVKNDPSANVYFYLACRFLCYFRSIVELLHPPPNRTIGMMTILMTNLQINYEQSYRSPNNVHRYY